MRPPLHRLARLRRSLVSVPVRHLQSGGDLYRFLANPGYEPSIRFADHWSRQVRTLLADLVRPTPTALRRSAILPLQTTVTLNRPPPGGCRTFTPHREVMIGFPSMLVENTSAYLIEAGQAEARWVGDMHRRDETGRGQTVGTIDSGAVRGHPDLTGQFAHVCVMSWTCNDWSDVPTLADRYGGVRYSSPLWGTPRSDHGANVNGVVAAKKNGIGVYGIAYEAGIVPYGNVAGMWHEGCHPHEDCHGQTQRLQSRSKRYYLCAGSGFPRDTPPIWMALRSPSITASNCGAGTSMSGTPIVMSQ